ncbi:HMA2 domain-containing protein [Thioflexithrix psekupsensis]|jgi:hypothetical protein|uniref:Uncharacterized protein n=1 Tax=Thioflexithrix psekupsensis TaxID=1570016 RepID=A0A251X9X8_9GAMM|nr:hypothetical protein [Thioflexithrix psekupsensis]OUD15025.1 hypothetical protein TPSD3_04830 [Thioflexithrix psekupsensis]
MTCYVHNIPGRLRIRANKLKYSPEGAWQLCQELQQYQGIDNTEYNPKAGSLVIFYNPNALSAEDILYQIHKTDLLRNCPTSVTRHPANHLGTILGNALFGTLLKKSIETSVLSIAKAIR